MIALAAVNEFSSKLHNFHVLCYSALVCLSHHACELKADSLLD